MDLVRSGLRLGLWWASDPRRVLGTVGVVWLNTLAGPVGGWSRAMTWGVTKGAGRTALAGLAFTARTTWARLLVPIALSPAVQTVGILAAPVVAAAAGAAVVTAAQQQVGLIGPSAPKATTPFPSLKGSELNPFFMGMGSVV